MTESSKTPRKSWKKYFSAFGTVSALYIGRKERKRMNKYSKKVLSKRLNKLGYTLGRDIFGWVVISTHTGFEWKFPTLGGVNRFILDTESLKAMNTP